MGGGRTVRTNGARRFGCLPWFGTVGAAATVTLLIALAPLAGASTKIAPYNHTVATQTRGQYQSGSCAHSVSLPSAKWVPKTGNLTASSAVTAKSCVYGLFGNGGATLSASNYFQIMFPLKVRSGGHNVSVRASYSQTLNRTITGTPTCPHAKNVPGSHTSETCAYVMSATSGWGEFIYDATNQSYLYGGSNDAVQGTQNYTFVGNVSSCNGSGSCSYYNSSYGCASISYYFSNCVPWGSHHNGTNTTWINTGRNCGFAYGGRCHYWDNWTLNGSHSLWVVEWFDYEVYVSSGGYNPGLTISVQLNAATLGNLGWRINSISVT